MNIDTLIKNADWAKAWWDWPDVSDVTSLRAKLDSLHMNVDHFKSLPIFTMNVSRFQFLRDL